MAAHKATIMIKAPAQKVFDAITKPSLVKLWQYEKVLATNWQPGHKIMFSIAFEGKILEQWGTVLEVQPNQLVKYNLFTPKPGFEDKPENYCTTTYSLTNENGATKVEIIQEDNRPNAFTPVSLMPILVSLKKTVESLES